MYDLPCCQDIVYCKEYSQFAKIEIPYSRRGLYPKIGQYLSIPIHVYNPYCYISTQESRTRVNNKTKFEIPRNLYSV